MAEAEKQGQLAVLKDAFRLVRREKPIAYVWCTVIFIATLVGGYFAGVGLGHPIYFGILAIPLALLAAFFTFTRFANTAAFSSIEGQSGAGASVLMSIRKGFSTTPAVNVSRNQDMVHRTVGRAGIILVGEGTPAVRLLVQDEKKKVERFVPGVPVHEIYVGNYDGAVPIRKLQKVVKKFPKKLSKAQLREVRNRLKGVGGMNMPIPKGPMPKGVKLPKR
ncbi:MAG: DUF4191 domain-containing protein [Actinomycetes bacterium]